MEYSEDEFLAKIIAEGGSIIMHKNDISRLKEATNVGRRPSLFNSVKIYEDKLGFVEEGKPIAAKLQHEEGE